MAQADGGALQGLAIDAELARERLEVAGDRVVAMLRSGVDGESAVPGLEWSAVECAAHLVTALRGAARYARGEPAPVATPAEVADVNAARVADLDERDPRRLADLLEEACAGFVDELRERRPDQPVEWYQREADLDLAAMACVMLTELLVHGLDIARSTGRRWAIEPGDASLAINGALPLLPSYVDAQAAAGLDARYELRVRGGPRVGLRFVDGQVGLEVPPDAPVDCYLSADPVAYLLVAYGRRSQWPAILTGKLVAWGRKPWLGMRFAALFHRP